MRKDHSRAPSWAWQLLTASVCAPQKQVPGVLDEHTCTPGAGRSALQRRYKGNWPPSPLAQHRHRNRRRRHKACAHIIACFYTRSAGYSGLLPLFLAPATTMPIYLASARGAHVALCVCRARCASTLASTRSRSASTSRKLEPGGTGSITLEITRSSFQVGHCSLFCPHPMSPSNLLWFAHPFLVCLWMQ